MNLFPDVEELIQTENLLSSTTYPHRKQTYCAYCGSQVIGDVTFRKKECFSINHCHCESAIEELKIKAQLIRKLEQLESMKQKMNLQRIGNALYEDGVERLRKKYHPNL
ncbi:hypothetical protein [Paenibacillus polymyxa]|uniref:Uncharacterized protein n=1 Tax=Paenibacillus polymyxa (strain SC2) TaxID=886882 RepID=E3ELE2_PAEPS|nr:hypothetical protein [Paenibacillus polymyxa]ADO59974.1 hypothetical protein PPSC2_28310 [Paenibacillus polymyxa SC2]WPQ59808.1 hypothetical protein SKN87_26325 [Paenibacillus polymyxa]